MNALTTRIDKEPDIYRNGHLLLGMLSRGIITPNEAREMMDLEPIHECTSERVTFYADDTPIFTKKTMSHQVPSNCPNCGAPVRGWECEYCGTKF